ncbi:hypothetical protein C4K16_2622 [Pseudomonas chlororaphis subsp. aurantiaca]|nr:hypothetical protein C4K16_2622 [Pseudomonas chlororaphis subsp. aurantiaca]
MSEDNLCLTIGRVAIWQREACEVALTEQMSLST